MTSWRNSAPTAPETHIHGSPDGLLNIWWLGNYPVAVSGASFGTFYSLTLGGQSNTRDVRYAAQNPSPPPTETARVATSSRARGSGCCAGEQQLPHGPALKRTLARADLLVEMQMRLTSSTCCRVVVGEVG
jgi:hypothetical protein